MVAVLACSYVASLFLWLVTLWLVLRQMGQPSRQMTLLALVESLLIVLHTLVFACSILLV